MPIRDDYEFLHVASAATSIVVGAACKLIAINVNTTAAGAVNVYNAATTLTCSSTNLVASLKASIAEGTYLAQGKKLATGLVVVTLGSSDITIVYANA